MVRSYIALALVLSTCGGDEPDLPPLGFESELAVIGIHAEIGERLCQGDLAHIDARLERAGTLLSSQREAPVTLYLVPFSIIDEVCDSDDFLACYRRTEDVIYTTWQSVDHEIVHAAARNLELSSLFWSEGAAEVLSGSTLRDDRITLEPADTEANALSSYRSAGHFSRFLVETHGWEAYRRIIRGDSFDEVYGRPAAALTTEYELDAPYAYPPLDPCPYPRIPQIDASNWQTAVEFSCESPDATEFEGVDYSRSNGAAVIRAVDLAAGTYELLLTGGDQIFAIACHTEVLSTEPTPPSNGDLYNEIDMAVPVPFEANEVHHLELTDGTYLFSISSGTYERASAELSIARVE